MKKIALTLLVACLCLEAGCSRPTAEAPVVAASPTPSQLTEAPVVAASPTPPPLTQAPVVAASSTPRQFTEEEKRDAGMEAARDQKRDVDLAPQPALPMTEALTRKAPSPSPSSSPRPSPSPRR